MRILSKSVLLAAGLAFLDRSAVAFASTKHQVEPPNTAAPESTLLVCPIDVDYLSLNVVVKALKNVQSLPITLLESKDRADRYHVVYHGILAIEAAFHRIFLKTGIAPYPVTHDNVDYLESLTQQVLSVSAENYWRLPIHAGEFGNLAVRHILEGNLHELSHRSTITAQQLGIGDPLSEGQLEWIAERSEYGGPTMRIDPSGQVFVSDDYHIDQEEENYLARVNGIAKVVEQMFRQLPDGSNKKSLINPKSFAGCKASVDDVMAGMEVAGLEQTSGEVNNEKGGDAVSNQGGDSNQDGDSNQGGDSTMDDDIYVIPPDGTNLYFELMPLMVDALYSMAFVTRSPALCMPGVIAAKEHLESVVAHLRREVAQLNAELVNSGENVILASTTDPETQLTSALHSEQQRVFAPISTDAHASVNVGIETASSPAPERLGSIDEGDNEEEENSSSTRSIDSSDLVHPRHGLLIARRCLSVVLSIESMLITEIDREGRLTQIEKASTEGLSTGEGLFTSGGLSRPVSAGSGSTTSSAHTTPSPTGSGASNGQGAIGQNGQILTAGPSAMPRFAGAAEWRAMFHVTSVAPQMHWGYVDWVKAAVEEKAVQLGTCDTHRCAYNIQMTEMTVLKFLELHHRALIVMKQFQHHFESSSDGSDTDSQNQSQMDDGDGGSDGMRYDEHDEDAVTDAWRRSEQHRQFDLQGQFEHGGQSDSGSIDDEYTPAMMEATVEVNWGQFDNGGDGQGDDENSQGEIGNQDEMGNQDEIGSQDDMDDQDYMGQGNEQGDQSNGFTETRLVISSELIVSTVQSLLKSSTHGTSASAALMNGYARLGSQPHGLLEYIPNDRVWLKLRVSLLEMEVVYYIQKLLDAIGHFQPADDVTAIVDPMANELFEIYGLIGAEALRKKPVLMQSYNLMKEINTSEM